MALHNVKNNAQSALAVGISVGDTTMTVVNDAFPNAPFYLSIESEILEVISKAGTEYTVIRGCDDTAATNHPSGTKVELRIVADLIRERNPIKYALIF